MRLTPEERRLIEEKRAKDAAAKAASVFQRNAIATAHAFSKWSARSGDSLTFSTFINSFGYQKDDGNAMYDAVGRILDAARPR